MQNFDAGFQQEIRDHLFHDDTNRNLSTAYTGYSNDGPGLICRVSVLDTPDGNCKKMNSNGWTNGVIIVVIRGILVDSILTLTCEIGMMRYEIGREYYFILC